MDHDPEKKQQVFQKNLKNKKIGEESQLDQYYLHLFNNLFFTKFILMRELDSLISLFF